MIGKPTMHLPATRWLLITGVMMGSLLWATFASAQDIELSEEVISTEIEKPEAFYVLRASQLEYEALEPKDSFLPELYETVKQDPFQ